MNRHLLIIYPHWPPSNLAGMHRARLVANGARDSGWGVTVITVHPDHYEEPHDIEMIELVRPGIEVIHTEAKPVFGIAGRRLIGDIGIRGYLQLKTAAEQWLKHHRTDFIWIPIPSWYTPLMGPELSRRFETPYGVDYIDPWVYQLTRHEPPLSRAWWTRQAALILEPRAIRGASIISGVAKAYFTPALQRTFSSRQPPETVSFPYGFDPEDHKKEPVQPSFPFDPSRGRYILYAGAFLPHSESFARQLFEAVSYLHRADIWPSELHLHFVGTGHRLGHSISDIAAEKGLEAIVHEHPDRIPFLSIQYLLRQAHSSLVLGSTEPHYTASKTFQCLIAGRPVISILHANSSAMAFIRDCHAAQFSIDWSEDNPNITGRITSVLKNIIQPSISSWKPDLAPLERHKAQIGTQKLLAAIESLSK